MNDQSGLPLQALPDGEAEVRLVLHLSWEDVAALGREAGRLAVQMKRPVSLDEAVSHRLRTRGAHAKPAREGGGSAAGSSSVTTSVRSPIEQARQAIEKINGSAPAAGGTTPAPLSAAASRPPMPPPATR